MVDPLSLVTAGGGITGPSSSANSGPAVQRSTMVNNFTDIGSGNSGGSMLLYAAVAVAAIYFLRKRRR